MVTLAALHSPRETTCRIAGSVAKNFFALTNQADWEWSISWFLTQKDRIRHYESDNFRLSLRTLRFSAISAFNRVPQRRDRRGTPRYAEKSFKSGRTQSLLTGSTYRGEALKERSEGCWRSGRRRSGDVGGGGTATISSIPCRAGYLLSTRCATNLRPTLVTHSG